MKKIKFKEITFESIKKYSYMNSKSVATAKYRQSVFTKYTNLNNIHYFFEIINDKIRKKIKNSMEFEIKNVNTLSSKLSRFGLVVRNYVESDSDELKNISDSSLTNAYKDFSLSSKKVYQESITKQTEIDLSVIQEKRGGMQLLQSISLINDKITEKWKYKRTWSLEKM